MFLEETQPHRRSIGKRTSPRERLKFMFEKSPKIIQIFPGAEPEALTAVGCRAWFDNPLISGYCTAGSRDGLGSEPRLGLIYERIESAPHRSIDNGSLADSIPRTFA